METVLLGFTVWAACALLCLAFVASICHSGRIEDQWALRHGFVADPTASPVDREVPMPQVPVATSIVRPRRALDEVVDAPVRSRT